MIWLIGLMNNWKLILIGIVVTTIVATVGSWYYRQNKEREQLQQAVNKVTIERDNAIANYNTVKNINDQNAKAVEQIKEQQDKILTTSNELKLKVDASRKATLSLQDKINAAPEKDNGPVAKVLKDTIVEIQKNRDMRVTP